MVAVEGEHMRERHLGEDWAIGGQRLTSEKIKAMVSSRAA
jgi:hypothetical protein